MKKFTSLHSPRNSNNSGRSLIYQSPVSTGLDQNKNTKLEPLLHKFQVQESKKYRE